VSLILSDCSIEVDGRKGSDTIFSHSGDGELTVKTAVFGCNLKIAEGDCDSSIASLAGEERDCVAILSFSDALFCGKSEIARRCNSVL
jgi:hypothetical protein